MLILTTALLATPSAARAPDQPNVIIVLTETLRADHLRAYGSLTAVQRRGRAAQGAWVPRRVTALAVSRRTLLESLGDSAVRSLGVVDDVRGTSATS